MTKLAIIGGGDLANAIKSPSAIFSHSNFDISNKEQCDQLTVLLKDYDQILITAGYHGPDVWNNWLVNTVGPAYIVSKLEELYAGKSVIVVTSYGGAWPAWPGISVERLTYNMSKSSCTEFMSGLVHSGAKNKITILETSKFQSKMSNYTGMDINIVAKQIDALFNSDAHIVKVQIKE